MNKTIHGLFLAVVLVLSPVAMSQELSLPTVDLAALRAAIFQPDPVFAQTQIITGGETENSCTVYNTCSDGTVISCSSPTGHCSSVGTYIVCDGVKHYCPCDQPARCPNGSGILCPPDSQICEHPSPGCLRCDGVIAACPGVTCS